ncbi:ABC transporter permease [Cohnella silvisoli]|uniref:ABC-2 family transporter protein n=1 Tax=Cohnella silvisoli TaxID=2873699 RepID=A0ABV1KQP0_9BACL|nr:ABC-2 family transporter protein [Cohnella silvisoli]MCD9025579.1 ABC transporter permease [Cohnella silvisoli]
MQGIRLYMRFIGVYLKSKIEYDHIFVFMDLVLNSVWPVVNMVLLWIMLQRFGNLAGWDFDHLLFLYNLGYLPFLISGMIIWNPTKDLQELVRTGHFDSYLTRPLNPLAHLIMRQFSHGHLFGLVLSIGMLVYSVNRLDLPVNAGSAVVFLSIVAGGALIYGAFMLFCGSLSFWFIKSESVYELVVYEIRSLIEFPLPIYNKVVQAVLLFFVPYAFINFIPAQGILFPDRSAWPPALQLTATPILGAVLFALAFAFFRIGIDRYQSTGN